MWLFVDNVHQYILVNAKTTSRIHLSVSEETGKETSPLHLICRDTDPCFKYQRSLSISISNNPPLYTRIKISPHRQIFRPQTVYRTCQWSPVYDRAIEHQSKDKHARSKMCFFPRSPVHPLLPPAHLETRSRSAIKSFRDNDSFPDH